MTTDPNHVWIGLDVVENGIPFSLRMIDQWVLWRAEQRADGKGTDKRPFSVTGGPGSSTNPQTWADFRTTISAYHEAEGAWSGVGFVATVDNGILLLDFDHVRNGLTGEIDSEVLEAVRWLGSYAEVSPSGTGVRVIGYGTLERAITSPTLQGWVTGRYVTVTGHRLEGAPAELQPIDPQRLADVVGWYAKDRGQAAEAPEPTMDLDPRQKLELRAALAYLDPDANYDTWIKVGMALKSTGARSAFGLWDEWSQKGSQDKYAPKIMRAKWASFTDRANAVSVTAVFALAQEAGWVNPATREAAAFEAKYGVSWADAEKLPPAPVVADIQQPFRKPFPVAELEAAANWINTAFALTHPVATDQAVLSLASFGAARLYQSQQGDPAHTYLGIVSRSVGDLRYVRIALHSIIETAGLRKLIRGTRFTSPQTIHQTLLRAPASLYATDEWGQMVAFAKRQPSGLIEQTLNAIADAYDAHAIFLDSNADAAIKVGVTPDDQPTIYAPALSLLALMSADQLEGVGRKGEWGRGSLEQMLTAIVPENSGTMRSPDGKAVVPDWLSLHLSAVRAHANTASGNLSAITSSNGGLPPATIKVVPWAPGALPTEHERFLIESIGKEDRRLLPLAYGGVKTLRRLSVAMAAWADPQAPVISRAITDWLGEYVNWWLKAFIDRVDLVGSDDGRTTTYQKVVETLVDAGTRGMSERELVHKVWAFRGLSKEKRTELVSTLISDKAVVEVEVSDRRKTALVAARYIAEAPKS